MKIDPHNSKQTYLKWKNNLEGDISGISKSNSDLIKKYINDMENGINISIVSIKGPRSYARLNSLRTRLIFFAKKFACQRRY